MKWLVAALLVGLAVAELPRPQHLLDNIVPMGKPVQYTSTCDECKSLAKRFVDVVHDKTKVAELKIILTALCEETSYAEECKIIVSRLDFIVKKMEPFFADAEKVCKMFHLCSNSNLDKFHRVALVFAKRYLNQAEGKNDLVCDECQFAAAEFKSVVDDIETQKKAKAFFSDTICAHLGQYQGTCDLLVEEFLPELFAELQKVLQDPKQACQDIGFCARASGVFLKKNRNVSRRPVYRLYNKIVTAKTSEPHVMAMSCLECKIIVDGVLLDLKTNASTYGIAMDIKNSACPGLPAAWLDGCDDFLNLYAPTVVSMTVDQFTSESVCEALKSCDPQSYRDVKSSLAVMTPKEVKGLECESCVKLSTLIRYEIAQPDFPAALEAVFDNYLCKQYIHAAFRPLCENLSRSYVPKLVPHLIHFLDNPDQLCRDKLHMC